MDKRPLTSQQNKRQYSKGSQMSQSLLYPRPQTTGNSENDSEFIQKYHIPSGYKKNEFGKPSSQGHSDLGFSSTNLSQSSGKMPFLKKAGKDAQMMDLSKIMPKSILQDKERLYEELIHCKQASNILKLENYKLSTTIITLKQDLKKYEDHVEAEQQANSVLGKITKTVTSKPSSSSEMSSIIPNLKKQVAELSLLLAKKDKEMNEIKRSVKLTKISELEVELKTYMDEAVRLKRLLQQSLSLDQGEDYQSETTPEERFLNQQNQIGNYKLQNAKLLESTSELQAAVEEKDKQIKEMERHSQRAAKDKATYKRLLLEKEKELDKYQNSEQISGRSERKNYNHGEGQFKVELEKKIQECNELNTKIQEKEKKISDLENKIKELRVEFQEKLSIETREKEQFRLKNEKEHQELVELRDKYDLLFPIKRNKAKPETAKLGASEISISPETPQYRTENMNGQLQYSNSSNLHFQVLQKNKTIAPGFIINVIGAELKARLRSKKIPFSDIENNSIITKQVATFEEMKIIFQREPFCIQNEEELNQLSHYVTENGNLQQADDIIQTDEIPIPKLCKVDKIKSLLKKCIGYYTIYSPKIHVEQFQEIQIFLNEKEKIIRSHFSHDNLNHIDKKKLENFLKSNDSILDPMLYDFVCQVSYESTQSTNHLNFEHIIQYFSQNTPKNGSLYSQDDGSSYLKHQKESINQQESSPQGKQYERKITDLNRLQSQDPDSSSPNPTERYKNPHNQQDLSNVPITLSMNYQNSQHPAEELGIEMDKSKMTKIEEEEERVFSPQHDLKNNENSKEEEEEDRFKQEEEGKQEEEIEL